jgi:nucleoside-diphosphate-sugar epimerase
MKILVIGGTGPTGPLLIKGLLDRKYRVTILHTGKHEVKLPNSVEHLHGNAHLLDSLKETIGNRIYDVIIGMYGRLRYVAEVVKGKTTRFISIGGAPYEAFVEGDKFPGGAPLFLNEEEPLFRDEMKNRFTYLMTISEELVMEAHQEDIYNATILHFPMIYGPRQVAPREWCIIRRILDSRKQIIVPDGGLKFERRGYAENVAHSVLLVVDNPEQSAGEIFNVGDETILSLKQWRKMIADTLDHEFEQPLKPPIPGIDGPRVMSAQEAYNAIHEIGENVVIIGAGLVGVELGLHLISEGKKVKIVEMTDHISDGGNFLHILGLKPEIKKRGLEIEFNTKAKEIKKDKVICESSDGEIILKADTVCYAVGQKPLREEATSLSFCAPEFYQLGDCVTPRNITSATSEAYMIGRNIGRF